VRFGFRLGPLYFSQRLGRTQAQKRAAAKGRQQRAAAKAHTRRMAMPETLAAVAAAHARIDRTYTGPVTMSDGGRTLAVADSLKGNMTIAAPDDRFSVLHEGDVVRLTPNEDGTALEEFEHMWYANGRSASEKSPLNWLRSEERNFLVTFFLSEGKFPDRGEKELYRIDLIKLFKFSLRCRVD